MGLARGNRRSSRSLAKEGPIVEYRKRSGPVGILTVTTVIIDGSISALLYQGLEWEDWSYKGLPWAVLVLRGTHGLRLGFSRARWASRNKSHVRV